MKLLLAAIAGISAQSLDYNWQDDIFIEGSGIDSPNPVSYELERSGYDVEDINLGGDIAVVSVDVPEPVITPRPTVIAPPSPPKPSSLGEKEIRNNEIEDSYEYDDDDSIFDDNYEDVTTESPAEDSIDVTTEMIAYEVPDGMINTRNTGSNNSNQKAINYGYFIRSSSNSGSELYPTKRFCDKYSSKLNSNSPNGLKCHFLNIQLTSYYCMADTNEFQEIWDLCRDLFDYDFCFEKYQKTVEYWNVNDSIYDINDCVPRSNN